METIVAARCQHTGAHARLLSDIRATVNRFRWLAKAALFTGPTRPVCRGATVLEFI